MAKGDALAAGARSVTFPSNSHISQERWDSIFGPRPLNISKPEKKTGKKTAKKNVQ
jgi:hypothetical protein